MIARERRVNERRVLRGLLLHTSAFIAFCFGYAKLLWLAGGPIRPSDCLKTKGKDLVLKCLNEKSPRIYNFIQYV